MNKLCPQASAKNIRLDENTNLNHFTFDPNANSSAIEELTAKLIELKGVVGVEGLGKLAAKSSKIKKSPSPSPSSSSSSSSSSNDSNNPKDSDVAIAKKFLAQQIELQFGPMGARLIVQLNKKQDLVSMRAFAHDCKVLIADSISQSAAEEFWKSVTKYFD